MRGELAPVPILQEEKELLMVLDVYRALRPCRVLEVGSWYGGTLYHWIKEAKPGAVVVSIDLPTIPDPSGARHQWHKWAGANGATLHTWEGNSCSPEAVKLATLHAPYDFIFIDGDHALATVQSDFANYFPLLRPGGVMALHDICAPDNHPLIKVGTWWRELKADGRYRLEELIRDGEPDTAGIGLVWREV